MRTFLYFKKYLKILEFITAELDVQDVPHHSTCTSPYNSVGSVVEQILYCLWESPVRSEVGRGQYVTILCTILLYWTGNNTKLNV
jgi:hypothetical protein